MNTLVNIVGGLLLLLVVRQVFAQIPYLSVCPPVSVAKNFDVEAYLGTWYEQEKYPFFFEIGGKCITATYTLRPDGKIGVTNRQINRILGHENSITGTAVADDKEPAKLKVTFPSAPAGADAPYWVLGTDYQNYAVVYSCSEFAGFASARTVWILTREQQPEEKIIRLAYDLLDSKQISKTFLMKTNQEDCGKDTGRANQTENEVPEQ